jgi:hypothetical protein
LNRSVFARAKRKEQIDAAAKEKCRELPFDGRGHASLAVQDSQSQRPGKQAERRAQQRHAKRRRPKSPIRDRNLLEIDVEPALADVRNLDDAEIGQLVEDAEVRDHLDHAFAERHRIPR